MADTFEVPGPGQWALDRSHYPGGTTPISDWLITESMGVGMERVFEDLGAPVRRLDSRFVNGFHYTRLVPLVGADKPPTRLPPTPVLKVMTRIHPEFRRRARQADVTLTTMPSIDVAQRWSSEIRPRLVAENKAFQDVAVDEASDTALDQHIGELLDHLRRTLELHFWLHGHDLGPVAQYVYACEKRWSVPASDAVRALSGASPSTHAPTVTLCRLRAILEDHPDAVNSLDEVRAVSDEAASLLDAYLADRGGMLVTGYDITSLTLNELPGVVLDSIRTARLPGDDADTFVDELRARIPADQRADFDGYLANARAVMDMRDDNGPQTAEWPLGLLRRALLEAGRRRAAAGDFEEPEHALELTPDEARRVMSGPVPDRAALAARSRRRLELAQADPPLTLGAAVPEPPLDVLPGRLPELVAMIQTAIAHLGLDGAITVDGLVGVGVGEVAYKGRACRAASADEAISKLEPGDVLVVRATSPAFNAVLTIAGAIVTANGGALSHAAVLARELGIPAVVGASGALEIEDGTQIEVDPVGGRVTVLT
jgi:rifampicin phosphotransferase